MAKKKDSYIVKAKGTEGLERATAELHAQGYLCLPAQFKGNDSGFNPDWGDTIRQQLSCNAVNEDGTVNEARRQAGMLFVSSGKEQATDDKIGTKGLGYMMWGSNDRLPNFVSLLTKMLSYTAAGWEFNTNLVSSLGPQPMFPYTRYVPGSGSVKTKEVPYNEAGILLKGLIDDLRKQIIDLKDSKDSNDLNVLNDLKGLKDHSQLLVESLEKQIADYEAAYNKWEVTNKEIQDFIERNNLHKTFMNLVGDFTMMYNSFPELLLNQQAIDPETGKAVSSTRWTPKVIGLNYRSIFTTRVERMDENNRINFAYLSNRWLDSQYVDAKAASKDGMSALPLLSESQPKEDLERHVREARQKRVNAKNRPTRFMMHLKYPSPGNPYYAIAPWLSILAGDIYEYASTMVSDRLTRKKNSNVIGRIIYIHNEYLQQIANQRTEEEIRKRQRSKNPKGMDRTDIFQTKIKAVQNEIFQEINNWLSNRSNSGQSLMAYLFRDGNGEMKESFKVVEIESNSKNTVAANEKELSEISSIIFFAMGLDSRLIGNTPGSDTNHGGTDLRERYMLKQLQKAPIQQLLIKPLEVTSQFNGWYNVVWRVKREVITTLDNSKTGITEQEPV